MAKYEPGSISWIDLTVDDAEGVRDFYREVAGWHADSVSMGEYSDYNMKPHADAEPVAGVCHRRGGNAGLPAQWMIYIVVEALDEALEKCTSHGGEVVRPPGEPGPWGRFAVIRDPAGAVCALYEAARE